MIVDRTVMFCVGAAKAGSSWLHRYLSAHPQCALPILKELHYFNRSTPAARIAERDRLAVIAARLRAEQGQASAAKSAALGERIAEITAWMGVLRHDDIDPAAYLAFLNRSAADDTRLIGDVTPAYGLLDAASLERMVAIAPDTRFVMLLRDPLDRLWSNLRMMAARRLKAGQEMNAKANALFARMLRGKEAPAVVRSDYAGIVSRLKAVIPAKRLHISFFEDLFAQDGVDRICAFLGLDRHPGDFARHVHASPIAVLADEQARKAAPLLLPQYDYVFDQMGTIPARWHQNREVLS